MDSSKSENLTIFAKNVSFLADKNNNIRRLHPRSYWSMLENDKNNYLDNFSLNNSIAFFRNQCSSTILFQFDSVELFSPHFTAGFLFGSFFCISWIFATEF